MKKVTIEEAVNGYIVRYVKLFGEDIIEEYVEVYHELDDVKDAVADYFTDDSTAGYRINSHPGSDAALD